MLRLRSVSAFYGQIQALRNVSIHVAPGEAVALIGANGSGKSTILRAISGLAVRKKGQILFNDIDITNAACERIVRLGISQVPEGRQVFASLSVRDNLILGALTNSNGAYARKGIERVYMIFPVLGERGRQLAGTLSGGEQQMLAIGRALMARPKLLLLDEPSMGLSPLVAREIFAVLQKLREAGTTILLVEQNARMALNLADRGYVIETGEVVIEGTSEELLANREVQRAYLGKEREAA